MKMGKIFSANLKMIYRDKISLFWALVFPLLFIALFGLFSTGMTSNTLGKLAFIDLAGDAASARFRQAVADSGIFEVLDQSWDEDEAKKALRNNDVSFVVIVESPAGRPDRYGGSP